MRNPWKDHLWLLILAILCAVSLAAVVIVLSPATPGRAAREAIGTFALALLVPLVHRLTRHVLLAVGFAVGVGLGLRQHLGDPRVLVGIVAAAPIVVLMASGRPARRWVPLALGLR